MRGITVPYPYTFATANVLQVKGGIRNVIRNVMFSRLAFKNRFNVPLSALSIISNCDTGAPVGPRQMKMRLFQAT